MRLQFTSRIRLLSELAETNPKGWFWGFATLHLILWTLLPWLSSPNAPLDVIEAYAWGHEWLWGTYKHPPMQAWILEILATLTGRASWAHFLASQVAVVVAFWAVWQTGRRIVGEGQALIGVLLLEGVLYYNFTSTEFNPNVLQLTFWALAGYSFHRAVKENRVLDWALLGVWAAGGLYTKYSTVLLLSVFAVMMITRPEARRCLKKPGPYIALFVGLALFAPHLVWLYQHDFLPFTYVKDRLTEAGPATRYVTAPAFFPKFLLSPLVFIVGQVLALLPASLLFLALDERAENSQAKKTIDKFDRTFLLASSFVPMMLTLIMASGFGFKIHDMWGAPFFNFAGLWALVKFYPNGARVRMRFVCAWVIIFFAAIFGFVTNNILSPYISNKGLRVHFPGQAMSQHITAAWHQRFSTPLAYVIGDTWPAGNMAYYAPERPHVFLEADTGISPWINVDDLKQKGGVVVWCPLHRQLKIEKPQAEDSQPKYIKEHFPNAEIQPTLTLGKQTEADVPPSVVEWAIIPPETGLSR